MHTIDNFEISNKHVNVRLNAFNSRYSEFFLKSNETMSQRQKRAETLLNYLCGKFKIDNVTLLVTDKPRPCKGRGQIHGWYVTAEKKIIIYNTTAKTHKPISIHTFYDTLLHEFMHHYDYKVLRLSESFHTSGFYKRISDLKNKLF